uniref:Secreted protein n=1 Tax=Rhabditophanes sp. KR3021 TaxID=114890 RepID=A0AC35TPT3_9BILA
MTTTLLLVLLISLSLVDANVIRNSRFHESPVDEVNHELAELEYLDKAISKETDLLDNALKDVGISTEDSLSLPGSNHYHSKHGNNKLMIDDHRNAFRSDDALDFDVFDKRPVDSGEGADVWDVLDNDNSRSSSHRKHHRNEEDSGYRSNDLGYRNRDTVFDMDLPEFDRRKEFRIPSYD